MRGKIPKLLPPIRRVTIKDVVRRLGILIAPTPHWIAMMVPWDFRDSGWEFNPRSLMPWRRPSRRRLWNCIFRNWFLLSVKMYIFPTIKFSIWLTLTFMYSVKVICMFSKDVRHYIYISCTDSNQQLYGRYNYSETV